MLPKEISLRGFNVVVSGTVPPAAGLSSSSALVSAAALATAEVHGVGSTLFSLIKLGQYLILRLRIP